MFFDPYESKCEIHIFGYFGIHERFLRSLFVSVQGNLFIILLIKGLRKRANLPFLEGVGWLEFSTKNHDIHLEYFAQRFFLNVFFPPTLILYG